MSLGPAEILVVLIIALVVFGPKRLPEVGRQVGGALRELRKVQDTVHDEIRGVLDDTTAPFHKMLANDDEPSPREPDLGDENPGDEKDRDENPIDGLSGGTFS
jgi:TatA/E family protein of Tat protein translocase